MSKLLLILVNMNRFTMSMRDLVRGAIPWTKLFWWNTALHQNLQTGLKGEKYNIYTRIVTKRYSCLLSIVTDTYSSKLIYTLKLDFRATKCTWKITTFLIYYIQKVEFHEVYFYLSFKHKLFFWLVLVWKQIQFTGHWTLLRYTALHPNQYVWIWSEFGHFWDIHQMHQCSRFYGKFTTFIKCIFFKIGLDFQISWKFNTT